MFELVNEKLIEKNNSGKNDYTDTTTYHVSRPFDITPPVGMLSVKDDSFLWLRQSRHLEVEGQERNEKDDGFHVEKKRWVSNHTEKTGSNSLLFWG